MDDTDEKSQLPVHITLGANDFVQIRTGKRLRVGHHGDPVANTPVLLEFNVSWSQRGMFQTYLAVNEIAISPTFCRLCGLLALDILDIRSDKPAGDYGDVHAEFNEAIHESI